MGVGAGFSSGQVRSIALGVIMLVLLYALGCTATCDQACVALLKCEEEGAFSAPSMNQDECQSACAAQENVYSNWDDQEKQQSFDDLKDCIVGSECSELADGVCYDENVYIW